MSPKCLACKGSSQESKGDAAVQPFRAKVSQYSARVAMPPRRKWPAAMFHGKTPCSSPVLKRIHGKTPCSSPVLKRPAQSSTDTTDVDAACVKETRASRAAAKAAGQPKAKPVPSRPKGHRRCTGCARHTRTKQCKYCRQPCCTMCSRAVLRPNGVDFPVCEPCYQT
eukprot:6491604-Amphidinium_carterae.1